MPLPRSRRASPREFVRPFGVLSPRLAVRRAWASALSILIAYTAAASIGRTTHGFIEYSKRADLLPLLIFLLPAPRWVFCSR